VASSNSVVDWEKLAQWLADANAAVAFTGAGISTESGIPDFRSPGGVWSRSTPVYFDEFLSSAEARVEYWRQKVESHPDFAAAEPNAGHRTLSAWEASGRLRGVITQNIDGLHHAAGSRQVLELHGTALWVACLECESRFDAAEMVERFRVSGEPPVCSKCGGLTKHATISFGQSLPPDVLEKAIQWSCEADLFFAIGSSLVVQPAAGLPAIARERGARLVIINRDATPLDAMADIVVRGSIGETLGGIDRALRTMA